MKIALFGYGKMGKEIEKMAIERGHSISLIVDEHNRLEITKENLENSDVIIDFTVPEAVKENVFLAFKSKIPIVVGTTGWIHQIEEINEASKKYNGALIHASNFSLGVNMFFEINERLAQLMNSQEQYEISVEETHHIEKKDAPSGTSISIAEAIIKFVKRKNSWKEYEKGISVRSQQSEIPVFYSREKDVVGKHAVTYKSAIDQIEIKHEAFNRKGFALGAIIASEWIIGKKGIFSIKDLMSSI